MTRLVEQKPGIKTLALIPARGGSNALPRRNILDLCGKPLIACASGAAAPRGA